MTRFARSDDHGGHITSGDGTSGRHAQADHGTIAQRSTAVGRRTFLVGLATVLVSPSLPALGSTSGYYGRGYSGGY